MLVAPAASCEYAPAMAAAANYRALSIASCIMASTEALLHAESHIDKITMFSSTSTCG